MLHAVHGARDCMASVGVMGLGGPMGFMFTCYRASPGSGTTLLRSIDPDCLNVNLISIHHPKEDLNPPATMQRGQHGSGGVIPGYPMGSGREHRSCDDQAGGTHYQSICSETPASRPVRSPSTCRAHPAGLSYNPHRAGALAPSFGKLSLRGERGFHQPVCRLIFPLRALARLRSYSRLPICRRASGEIPCAYGNARWLTVCRRPELACYQYTMKAAESGLKSHRQEVVKGGKFRSQRRQ